MSKKIIENIIKININKHIIIIIINNYKNIIILTYINNL